MADDEELAHELLLGIPGPKGRKYLEPGSERELSARAALARVMRAEAPHGYFTLRVANLIDPRRDRAERKIQFRRVKRGTPIRISDRQRAEIAAYIHDHRARGLNLKKAWGAAQDKFDISRGTVTEIWKHFRPIKQKNRNWRSPTKQ